MLDRPKTHKLLVKNAQKDIERILLTESQYNNILYAIKKKEAFITITELDKTFKKYDIVEISRIGVSERNEMINKSKNPITVQEDLYIIDNKVQKQNGESIWLEIKKQAGKTLSRKKIVYVPIPNKSCKRVYI
jgi:hypothetical protein